MPHQGGGDNHLRLSRAPRLGKQRAQLVVVDVVPEALDAVDLHHGDALAILPLEVKSS